MSAPEGLDAQSAAYWQALDGIGLDARLFLVSLRSAVLGMQLRSFAPLLDSVLADRLLRVQAWSMSWSKTASERAAELAVTAGSELAAVKAERGDALRGFELRMIRNALEIVRWLPGGQPSQDDSTAGVAPASGPAVGLAAGFPASSVRAVV